MSTKVLINIKTDIKLKKEAQEVSRELGLPLGTIINAYLRDFVRQKRVVFSVPFEPNQRTQKLLEKIQQDLKTGKNATKPLAYDEAVAYLDTL
jgi:addiction module RelB/DinJ family antitoxin